MPNSIFPNDEHTPMEIDSEIVPMEGIIENRRANSDRLITTSSSLHAFFHALPPESAVPRRFLVRVTTFAVREQRAGQSLFANDTNQENESQEQTTASTSFSPG